MDPEIDLIDEKGDKKKLEVYEQKEDPIRKDEILKVPPKTAGIINFYNTKYKALMIIPILLIVFALVSIGVQVATTGDFIYKDVSLKGGATLTLTGHQVDTDALTGAIEADFPSNDVLVRSINDGGEQIGVIIAVDIEGTDEVELNALVASLENFVGQELGNELSVEVMGSSLGQSFFRETFVALIIAFLLMSVVILIYFRAWVPSMAVILAAFSDIIITLAIVNLLGMKLSTGGIAAFLMLIGYSVDTNVLLNTRVLKRRGGTVDERILGALKTGLMMTVTTVGALGVALFFVQSAIIQQIMTIVLIGLVVDTITTWIMNVGILRIHLGKNETQS